MDSINQSLAERLRRERDLRGWSLAELADQSGVSRAMISKIERAEASPTAELLNRLCVGLGITLSTLFAPLPGSGRTPSLSRRAEQPEWRDPATGYIRRNVSPPGGGALFEIVDITFPAGQRVVLDSWRDLGIAQQIWLLEGTMDLTLGDGVHRLEAGDCLDMRLNQPIAFHNPTDRPTRYAVILAKTERQS